MNILVGLIPHIVGWFLGWVTVMWLVSHIEARPITKREAGIMALGAFLVYFIYNFIVVFF